MTTVEDILSILERCAPPEMKMDFDNVGLLVGRRSRPVHRILLALDITQDVIGEASRLGAELIVSHHPVLFGEKRITDDSPTGSRILALAEGKIAAICMHTNLDAAENGVNDALASALGLSDTGMLAADGTGPDGLPYGIGRIGTIREQPLGEFLALVKKSLRAPGLRFWDAGRPVKRVAVLGGSGGGDIEKTVQAGCDTYVTGEVKYHQWLDAKEYCINLVEAGHFCTENPVIQPLAQMLAKEFPLVSVHISEIHRPTACFFVG